MKNDNINLRNNEISYVKTLILISREKQEFDQFSWIINIINFGTIPIFLTNIFEQQRFW